MIKVNISASKIAPNNQSNEHRSAVFASVALSKVVRLLNVTLLFYSLTNKKSERELIKRRTPKKPMIDLEVVMVMNFKNTTLLKFTETGHIGDITFFTIAKVNQLTCFRWVGESGDLFVFFLLPERKENSNNSNICLNRRYGGDAPSALQSIQSLTHSDSAIKIEGNAFAPLPFLGRSKTNLTCPTSLSEVIRNTSGSK